MNRNKQESVIELSKDALTEKKKALKIELDDYSRAVEVKKTELANLEKQAQDFNDLSIELESTRIKLHSLFKEEAQFLSDFEDTKKKIAKELESYNKSKEDVAREFGKAEKTLSDLNQEISQNEVNFEARKAQQKAELKSLQDEAYILIKDSEVLKTQYEKVSNDTQKGEVQLQELESLLKTLSSSVDEYSKKDKALNTELNEKQKKLDTLNKTLNGIEGQINDAQAKADEIITKANAHKYLVDKEIDDRQGLVSLREQWIDNVLDQLSTAKKELEIILGRPLTKINLNLDEIK